jgi:hypothetical protein
MKYDLEIVVPVSNNKRTDDFKKYGIINIKDRKVLVTTITSGSKIEDTGGWPSGVDVRSAHYSDTNYVANVYRNFLELERNGECRWIMKIDDDSSTDVDAIVEKLDMFYDHREKLYLASSMVKFGELCYEGPIIHGPENELKELYLPVFGDVFLEFDHEIESCVMSQAGLSHIISDPKAKSFLEARCAHLGGVTDTALAFASIIAKLHPTRFPFSTHLPMINKFSVFGGKINHIHMIARIANGENFGENERCGEVQYLALTRAIDGVMTKVEEKISGRKFLLETETELKTYEFRKNRTLKIKFDEKNYIWVEFEGEICIFYDAREIYKKFTIKDGNLIESRLEEEEEQIVLKPL